jgi:hypothetical protein
LLVHAGYAGAPAGEVVREPAHRRRARRHRPTDAGTVREWLRLFLELCSTITSATTDRGTAHSRFPLTNPVI